MDFHGFGCNSSSSTGEQHALEGNAAFQREMSGLVSARILVKIFSDSVLAGIVT